MEYPTPVEFLKIQKKNHVLELEHLNKQLLKGGVPDKVENDAVIRRIKEENAAVNAIDRAIATLEGSNKSGRLVDLPFSAIGKSITVTLEDGSEITGVLEDLSFIADHFRTYANNSLRTVLVFSLNLRVGGNEVTIDNVHGNTPVVVHEPATT